MSHGQDVTSVVDALELDGLGARASWMLCGLIRDRDDILLIMVSVA